MGSQKWGRLLFALVIGLLFSCPSVQAAPQEIPVLSQPDASAETETTSAAELYHMVALKIRSIDKCKEPVVTMKIGPVQGSLDKLGETSKQVMQYLRFCMPRNTFWLQDTEDYADMVFASDKEQIYAYINVAPEFQDETIQGKIAGNDHVLKKDVSLLTAAYQGHRKTLNRSIDQFLNQIPSNPWVDPVQLVLWDIKRELLSERSSEMLRAAESSSAISVLDGDLKTQGNSSAYAKAFQLLFDDLCSDPETGTLCHTVSGKRNQKFYTWNIVSLNGSNYLVDLKSCETADDLFLVNTSGQLLSDGTVDPSHSVKQTKVGTWSIGGNEYQCDEGSLLWGDEKLTLGSSQTPKPVVEIHISSAEQMGPRMAVIRAEFKNAPETSTVEYGYRYETETELTTWQSSTELTGLEPGTYYVAARVRTGEGQDWIISPEVALTIKPQAKAMLQCTAPLSYTGKAVSLNGGSKLQAELNNCTLDDSEITWYADRSGAQGEQLREAPCDAGSYWVRIAPTAEEGCWMPDPCTLRFTIAQAPIQEVAITVTAPVKWQTPNSEVFYIAKPASSLSAPLAAVWKTGDGTVVEGLFQPNTAYQVALEPKAAKNYQLTGETLFKVNGQLAAMEEGIVTDHFPKTEPAVFTGLSITTSAATITVPEVTAEDLETERIAELPLNAAASYDDHLEAPITDVSWSVTPPVEGVRIENGKLIVTNRVPTGTAAVTVEAAYQGKHAQKRVSLFWSEDKTGFPTFLKLYQADEDVTAGNAGTLYIPGRSGQSSLQLRSGCCDGYGKAVDYSVHWSLKETKQGVSITDAGLLRVSWEAEAGDCVVQCTGEGLIAETTVSLELRREVTISCGDLPASMIYGDTLPVEVTATGADAPVTISVLPGSGRAVYDSETGNLSAAHVGTIKLQAVVDGAETVAAAEREVTIQPRTVTLTEVTAAPKIYDGTRAVTLLSGQLENSVDADLTVEFGEALLVDPHVSYGSQPVTYTAALPEAFRANYTLSAERPTLEMTVQPKPLTITGFRVLPRDYDPQNRIVTVEEIDFGGSGILPGFGDWTAQGLLPEGDLPPGTHEVELTLTLKGEAAHDYTLPETPFRMEQEQVITPLPAPEPAVKSAAQTVKAYQETPQQQFGCAALLQGIPKFQDPEIFDITVVDQDGDPLLSGVSAEGSILTWSCRSQPAGVTATIRYSVRSRNHLPITGMELTLTAEGKRNAELHELTIPVLRYGTATPTVKAAVQYPGSTPGTWTWTGDGTYLRAEDLGGGQVRLIPLKPTQDQASLTVTYVSDTTEMSHTWSGLAVQKGQVVITVPDRSIFLGDDLPKLTDLLPVISGLHQGDTLARLPVLSFGAEAGTHLGSFAIRAAGALVPGNGYYESDIVYVFGSLTVTTRPAPPKPPLPPLPDGGGFDSNDKEDVGGNREPGLSPKEIEVRPDGTTVETIRHPDGGVTVTEWAPDGTMFIHEVDGLGNQAETVVFPDGSYAADVATVDGTLSRTEVDAAGHARAQVLVSDRAMEEALETGRALDLPMPALQVNRTLIPVVRVDLPSSGTAMQVVVPIQEPTPGMVAVLVDPEGRETVLRKSSVDEFGVVIPLQGTAVVKIMDRSRSFQDVSQGFWANDAISFVTARNLYQGTSASSFSPNTGMTRGMLAKVLHNLESNPTAAHTGTFSDVGKDLWCGEAITWAAQKGIVSGYADGSFQVGKTITREQLATMLYRYAGSPESSGRALAFTDAADVSGYATEAMTWAVDQGIIGGTQAGTLNPQGTATRAQVAAMLTRYLSPNL